MIELKIDHKDERLGLEKGKLPQLPTWIKIFGWLFIVIGALSPLFYISALLLGFSAKYAFLGLSYFGTAYDIEPAIISFIFVIHGVVAYGLLFGKTWGVTSCLCVGYLGVVISLSSTTLSSFNNISFEPMFLIPYIWFLHKYQKVALNNIARK